MSERVLRESDVIAYLTKEMNWYTDDGYEVDEDEKRDDITDIVAGIPTAETKTGEWIPVSERLPKTHIEHYEDYTYQISAPVLICNKEGNMYVTFYENDGYGMTYWNDYTGFSYSDIIAWMPLPEPYKGGDDE